MSYLGQTGITHLQSAEIRVLHVDDQRDIVELSSDFLERESDAIEVLTETTVQDGLQRLASERVDCIVSDYDMPGCNGLEFLEYVREDHGDIPFILYTGKGSEEIASKAISAGVTDYLQKETGANQYTVLANRIENAVEQYRSQRAVEATEQKLSQIAERTDDILFMFDDEWNELLFVNSAYEDICGGSISELRDNPRSFLDYVHPNDRDIAERSIERLQCGESDTVEYRVVTDEGDQRWVRGETKPILDDDGELLRITGFVRDITDRKEYEQELQARAAAMETATDGIAILNEDQEYVFMNEAHAEIYGYDDPDQLLGESWQACYADAEIARFESEILPQLAENGSWNGEMTVTAADGQTIHQDLTLKRLDDGRVVCAVRDITEQREHEQELERYKILVDEATDMIGVVSEGGTVQYQNPAIERILGYDPDAFEGTTAFEYMHPDDQNEVMERFYELVTDESDRTDRVGGYVITSRDITERREREQQLRQYEKIYDTIDDGLYVVDEEGQFVMVNKAYAEMFGYDREELLGEPVSMIVDKDTAEQVQQLEAAMRHDSADTQTIEAELPTSDGDHLSLEAKLALLPVSDEREHRVGVVRNITERKEREQQLQRQNERLNEFAGVVSHDLRNPLRVADGQLELAAQECDSKHLEHASKALDRMEDLIEDLLTLAHEGEAVSDLKSVNLAAIAEDCWATVQTGDATLTTCADCDIYADESRLKQVLENLVRNTAEHGGDGVSMAIGELDDGFYIEDDGPGIPEDKRDEVFDAGFSTNQEGTGFGLSIVKRIVEAHGWEICITESSGDGTRFEITGVEFAPE